MRDLANNIAPVATIAPAVLSATTTGAGVDLLGANSAALIISTGAIVGSAVMVPKLQDSDDNSTFTDVAAADLVGSLPAQLAAASIVKVGYIGTKRYVRAVLTLSSGTSIAASATVIKGGLNKRPA